MKTIIIIYLIALSILYAITSCESTSSYNHTAKNNDVEKIDSIQLLTDLIKKHPNVSDYHFRRSYHYFRNNDSTKAINDINSAIILDNLNFDYHHLKGFYYYTYHDDEKAMESFIESYNLGSKDPETFSMIGNIHALKGYYKDAIHWYDKAIGVDPDEPMHYFNKAFAYRSLKNNDEFLNQCMFALERDSIHEKTLTLLIDYYTNIQYNEDQALHFIYKFTKAHPKHPLGHYEMGYYWYNQFKKQNSVSETERKNFLKRSIEEYSLAIEFDSKYERAYYQRGYAYFDNKQYDFAISDFEKALSIYPDYYQAAFMLGTIYEAFEDIDQAKKYYQLTLDISPNFQEAKAAILELG